MRKAIIALIVAVTVVLAGCTPIFDETESTLGAVEIELAGQRLPLPFVESDLPDGYSFSNEVNIYAMGERYYYCSLIYDGLPVTNVYLSNYTDGMKKDEFIARSVGFSSSDSSDFSDTLTINGIGKDSTYSDIIRTLGSPQRRNAGSDGVDMMTYTFQDGTNATFWCRRGETVTKVMVFKN